jgi:hypothetical protein
VSGTNEDGANNVIGVDVGYIGGVMKATVRPPSSRRLRASRRGARVPCYFQPADPAPTREMAG